MFETTTLAGQLAVLLLLIVANWLFTVCLAVGAGKFDWEEFPKWLWAHVGKLVVPWVIVAGLGWLATKYGIKGWESLGIGIAVQGAYATAILTLVKKAVSSLKDLGTTTTDIPATSGDAGATPNAGK